MINNSTIQGRFVKDIELKETSTGRQFCSFTLASDRGYKDKNGEKVTDFIDCVAWGKTAEFISKYFHKGDMTVAVGQIQPRTYEKDGIKRKITEINVTDAAFCGKRESAPMSVDTETMDEIDDAELPF